MLRFAVITRVMCLWKRKDFQVFIKLSLLNNKILEHNFQLFFTQFLVKWRIYFSRKGSDVEKLFDEKTFPQNTSPWMLLTLGFCLLLPRREDSFCEPEKKISQQEDTKNLFFIFLFLIYLFSYFLLFFFFSFFSYFFSFFFFFFFFNLSCVRKLC